MTKLVDERDTMDNARETIYRKGLLAEWHEEAKKHVAEVWPRVSSDIREVAEQIYVNARIAGYRAIATSQQAGSAAAPDQSILSWSGHFVRGDDASIKAVKNALHDAGTVPELKQIIADERARVAGSAAVEPTPDTIATMWDRHFGDEEWPPLMHKRFAFARELLAIGSAEPALAVPRSPLGHATESPAEAVQRPAVGTCGKCGGLMRPGKAIAQTWGGVPDFIGGEAVTMSLGGPGRLIDCLKCAGCGWSVTPAASGNPATARSDAPK